MYDPERYRTKDEVEHWKKRDPIVTFKAQLTSERVLDAGELERLEHAAAAEIEDAIGFAEAGALEPVEELSRFVYSDEGRDG
jgi:TPP-dependent pyruvate/acetoin dehydrogenase alpha subunit